jgi:hypothetical protein
VPISLCHFLLQISSNDSHLSTAQSPRSPSAPPTPPSIASSPVSPLQPSLRALVCGVPPNLSHPLLLMWRSSQA